MRASSSETSSVSTLDAFYEELAETAENEGLCLPWYKTYLVVRAQQQRRFRSEITLPGLRLQSSEGQQYFIPEAKFIGISENRKGAENAAASEACGFLKNFVQRPELNAAGGPSSRNDVTADVEWRIDRNNALYQSIADAQSSPSSSSKESQPTEGHRFLMIAPVVPSNVRNRKTVRPKLPHRPSPSPRTSKTGSSSTDGENLALLSNEVNLLKIQIDRLNMLVERHHPAPASASITQPTSTSRGPVTGPT